jgi:lysophospholipase L1-like esterase
MATDDVGLERSRRRRRETDDGRRTLTAGHALMIAVLALALGTLLNAPGLHKAAYNQPAGTERDVALALTGPLASVSHALFLDRPRKGLQSVLGRSGEDRIDTAIVIPVPLKPVKNGPKAVVTPPLHKPAFGPRKRLRLWIAGDSLVIVPGLAIVRAAGRAIKPVGGSPDGRVATGLERPDVFNWFTRVADVLRTLEPNAVVVDFGGNDDHGYMTGLPKGVEVDGFGTPSWTAEYGRRVGGIMDTVTRAHAFLVWIGLPITRDAAQTQRFDTINAIVASEARRRSGSVAFVDTYATFASDTGGFAQYLPNASGNEVLVRSPDGVHFEPAGGDMIARLVLHRLNEAFDLTSWRKKSSR